MTMLRAIITAFACFSTIPMPPIPWDDANMRYMMAAFPLVGAVIGALCMLWAHLGTTLGFGPLLMGVGYALIPVIVSGGIHLDGLADVIDAESSHASPKRKREILKDPHIGAFAAIGTCSYLMAYAALAGELGNQQVASLACIPIISRCLSGLVTVTLKASKSEGMLATEQASADARVVRIVLAIVWLAATGALVATGSAAALLATFSAIAVLFAIRRLAMTQYGGMSGDLAGCLLELVELAMLASIVLVGKVW